MSTRLPFFPNWVIIREVKARKDIYSMIKNVVLDIGGVLIDFAWAQTMREMGCSEECIDAVGKGFINTPLWDELDLGIQPEEDALEAGCNAVPEYADEIRAMWENNIKAIRPYDYCVDFVKGLKDKGFKVFLLTNYPETLYAKSVEFAFPFYPYLDGEVVSAHVKQRKPDKEIYQTLLDKYSLNPDECVFFDDRSENVEGAKAAGLHAFVFHNPEEAVNKIMELNK